LGSFFLRLGDYVFVMRPLILIPAWSFYLLGAGAGRRTPGDNAGYSGLAGLFEAPEPFYYGIACLTAILVCAYLINQVFDQESDRQNHKGFYLTQGIFRVRTVVLMSVIAFLVAAWLYRHVAGAQRPPLLVALVLSLLYSLPPMRLVSRPFADLLANAAGYGGIAFISGYAAYHGDLAGAVAQSLPYVFLVGATFLFTTILDVDGDRVSGKVTTSVAIGVKPSAVTACVLTAAGWCVALLVNLRLYGEWIPLVVLSASMVLFAAAAARAIGGFPGRAASVAVQVATVLITLPALFLVPVYGLLLVPLLVAARLYYRRRFGVSYPGVPAGPTDA
jgi:1,4-dihydroxy-2-naphthoate octaprenyltransferase